MNLNDSENFSQAGWTIEDAGIVIAQLEDYISVDGFWDSYRLRPEPSHLGQIENDEFWDKETLCFRSASNPDIAVENVICRYSVEDNRLFTRGLIVA